MLKVIEIENIKGIGLKRFELDITPNKPSILVAPNGFGKSSIATAFNSMNNRRIDLHEDDLFMESNANAPAIRINYQIEANNIVNLEATATTNTIKNQLDYYVINNQTKPKGNASTFGGFANAKATLLIEPIVLVDRIPENVSFGYSYRAYQTKFGASSRVLPNASNVFSCLKLIDKISEKYTSLTRANGARIAARIQSFLNDVNGQHGTAVQIHDWILANKIEELRGIEYLNEIGNIINEFDIGLDSEVKSYLAAIQVIWLYNDNPHVFKKACDYSNYKLDKEEFDLTLSSFNTTWKNIRASQTGGQLVVNFPKAMHISNGQRDILTFICMINKAKRCLNKHSNILIIDEVFDYLDDANLISAQYYITKLIKEFSENGRRLYPLILTHLNPYYFKNFAFNNMKVYYLDKSTIQVNANLSRLLMKRNDASIDADVSKFLLHFHPEQINKRAEFRALRLPELWGESNNFVTHLNSEIENYLSDREYDPFAVCGAVRIKIEEIAYHKLTSDEGRLAFLEKHTTRKKLDKAGSMGVITPETHYLLGIIYNEGMHWKEGQDNVSPIASKLENMTIKKLIRDVFN
jgi:hypothetical protein